MLGFKYYTPTEVYFGKGVEKNVGEEIKKGGYKKVLVHYGGGSIKNSGLFDVIVESLNNAGVLWIELGGVEPNPKIGLIREGIELCRKESVDFILAVGGGSVIDSAKSIGLGLAHNRDPWEMIINAIMPEKSFPVGVVLTIAAAGSEMSYSHVVTNPEGGLKRSLNHDLLRPRFAFMNPELTYSVSKYQTACGIVDIMMHTLERYATQDRDADLMDRISEGLLVAVKEAGKVAIKEPNNYEARATLMWASSLSHNGVTGCGKTAPFPAHKIEHELSGMFDHISHGAGLAVIFPAWAKYVYKYDINKFCQLATRVWNVEMNFDHPERTALEGIEAMKQYFKSIGMPTTLKELGVGEESFEEMAEKCTGFGKYTYKSYVELGKKEIIDIYKIALGE